MFFNSADNLHLDLHSSSEGGFLAERRAGRFSGHCDTALVHGSLGENMRGKLAESVAETSAAVLALPAL